MDADTAGFIGLLVLVCTALMTITLCNHLDHRHAIERNSKCFEQTADKACWGMK